MKIAAFGFAAAFALSLASATQASDRVEGKAPIFSKRAFPNVTLIYEAAGVRDSGGAINVGVSTSIHCTNWTAATVSVRHVVRNYDNTITSDNQFNVLSLRTHTASTHGTVAFNEDAFLSTGTLIEQGSVQILASAAAVTCSVSVIDAAAANPVGIDLHLVRFNARSGTEE